jgi:Tol biopolymer transport system component
VELAWSPDGRWLAYLVDTNRHGAQAMHVARVDRVVQRQVVSVPEGAQLYWLRWSPDSKQLAVRESDEANRSMTWVSAANGLSVRRFEGGFDDWSPDGSRFLLDKQGGSITVVASRTRAERFLVQGYSARWSPNGARIAFSATTRRSVCTSEARVFSVDTSGGGRLQLGPDSFPFSQQVIAGWARDSSRVAYYDHSTFGCSPAKGAFLAPADGSRQVTPLGDDASDVAWSPGGRRLAVRDYGTGDLRIMTPDGAPQTTIHEVADFGWGPQGGSVVLTATAGERPAGIYIARADGTGPARWLGPGAQPVWSRSGWIAFPYPGSCDGGGDRVFAIRPNGKRFHALSRCRSTS